jgi:copper homeostasis protein CutC
VSQALAELDIIVTHDVERATRRGLIGVVVGVIAGDEQVVKGLGRARDESAEPPNPGGCSAGVG